MELEVIIENLTKNYKNLQSVIKNLKEIFRLDKNRIDNIYKLKNKLTKFEKLITNLDMTDNNILNLKEWLNQYKLILEDTTDQIKRKFGSELEEQLNKFGLKLFGKFRENPRKDYYKSYNRADFSYDLYRIKEYQSKNTLQYNLCLRVATREFTKQRYNFLWVPDNESDKGTTYSHLYFKEVLKNVSTEP